MDVDKIVIFVKRHWAVIKRHWSVFLVFGVVVGAITWTAATNFYGQHVSTVEARLKFSEDKLKVCEDRRRPESTGGGEATPSNKIGKPDAAANSAAEPSVEFRKPLPGTEIAIGQPFQVEGRISAALPGKDVWLVHRRSRFGLGWPRTEKLTLTSLGEFGSGDWDSGAPGAIFVCAIAVEPEETARFETWLQNGERTKKWPALNVNQPASRQLGCVEVRLVTTTR